MDRDRHDRNTCRETRQRERLLIGSTESLRTGQESGVPPLAGESPIPSGGLCLSRRDGPDVGGELAANEARARRGAAAGLRAVAADSVNAGEKMHQRAGVKLHHGWVPERSSVA